MNRRDFLSFLQLPVIVGAMPNQIIDGQLADAGPVMGNYNFIASQVNANAMPLTGPFYGGGFQDVNQSNTAYGFQALISNASGTGNSAFGQGALSALTQSSGNVAVGSGAMAHFNGAAFINTNNIAIGLNAAGNITTATDNTAIGAGAMLNSTTASGNVAIGSGAAANYTSSSAVIIGFNAAQNWGGGNSAVAIGASAMQNSAGTGAGMTAIGASAMASSGGSAFQCTALGTGALSGVNGANNTALGWNSGGVTTGTRNVTAGSGSGSAIAAGNDNVAIGHNALIGAHSNCTLVGSIAMGNSGGANDVTAIGFGACTNAQSAGMTGVGSGVLAAAGNTPNCVAVGFNAGTALSNANGNCTLIGYQAGFQLTSGFNNIAVGNSACGGLATSNSVAIGPFALGAGGGSNDICIGVSAGQSVTGSSNVFIGYQAGFSGTAVTTGDHLTLIGDNAQCNANNYTNSVGLGNAAIVTASNTIVLGNSSIGFIRCQVQTINTLSDRRDKYDVEDLALGADFVKQLKPVSYRMNSSPAVKRYGFIAQEVQSALMMLSADAQLTERTIGDTKGNLALLMRENDERGTYLLGYTELIAPMVRAIQELTARIQVLEKNAV
jgi:hypothetical protein